VSDYNNFWHSQHSAVNLGVIEKWFHCPPHLTSATTIPWEITEHKKQISP